MKNTFLILRAILFVSPLITQAQNKNECIAELLSYESMVKPTSDSIAMAQNIFFNYTVRATNWDNETTVSNVKMYRQGPNLNLFSEQALIYKDETETLIVIPEQKVVIINSTLDEKKENLNYNFFEMREMFMDSCDVVKCEQKNTNYKTLVLRAKKNNDDLFQIESMTYEYNPLEKKILSVKVDYKSDYKLKQMIIIYKEYTTTAAYKFPIVKKQYADKRGNIVAAFKDFEIIDNRDKKSGSKEKS